MTPRALERSRPLLFEDWAPPPAFWQALAYAETALVVGDIDSSAQARARFSREPLHLCREPPFQTAGDSFLGLGRSEDE